MLCEICRGISLQEMQGPDYDRMQPHQPSYLALKQSMLGGCQLCSYIWTAFGQFVSIDGELGSDALKHVSEAYPGREISMMSWGTPPPFFDSIQVVTSGDPPDISDSDSNGVADPTMHPDCQNALFAVLNTFAYPDDPAAIHGGVTGRPLPTSAGDSDTDFAFVEKHLQDCLDNHPYCEANSDVRLPTRVLDIGSSEPYLLETKGAKGRYITLSHCWGGKVPLTTTTTNLAIHKKAVPLGSMPRTFRHAVQITKRLGIQYLWIDSLCILQDSKHDWEIEASKMGDVYRGSYLTIAARAATSADVGCFIPREEPPTCKIDYKSPGSTSDGSIYILDPAFELERVTETPLDTRGWVFQERILSPRILHYGAQQIYWECRQATIRQDGKHPDIHQDNLRIRGFKESLDVQTPCARMYHTDNSPLTRAWTPQKIQLHARMGQWYFAVASYSARSLSFDSDRLPAVAGIAKTVAASTGFSYVAGLWWEDILSGLLWYRKAAAVRSKSAPTSSRLPSWSWARFAGEISFWKYGISGDVNYVDDSCEAVDVTYRSTDLLGRYGEVCDARIELVGRLVAVRWKKMGYAENIFPAEYLTGEGGVLIGRIRMDHGHEYIRSCELFCLLINGARTPAGLALKRVPGRDSTFERVGYVGLLSDDFRWGASVRGVYRDTKPCRVYLV